MKEERLAILKMVEDGKINADDAVKLLDAISKPGKKTFENVELESKLKTFAKSMDEMGRELGKKLEEVGKDVEPKIKKAAQTIVEKTNECAMEIAAAFRKGECCDEDDCCDEESTCCGSEDNTQESDEGNCCCNNSNEPHEN